LPIADLRLTLAARNSTGRDSGECTAYDRFNRPSPGGNLQSNSSIGYLPSERDQPVRAHAALLGCAIAAALTPSSSAAVERWYSNGLFPRLQPLLTSISNLSRIAFLDLLILAVILWLVIVTLRSTAFRKGSDRPPTRALVQAGSRILGAASLLYLVFLLTWGLNYRRVPLAERLPFDPARVSVDRARALAVESTARLNALYDEAHATQPAAPDAFDAALARAFHGAAGEFGVFGRPLLPRPKRSLLDAYFRRAGVAGMTDPFFLEALIASDLLPIERPIVIAHEWGHVAGLADEGEANFAGWLTCLNGAPAHQYSGWLFAYNELAGALAADDRRAVAARLGPGPRGDLAAIAERLRRHVNPRVSAAGWRVYDGYLKANRVAAGAASYSEVVRLMLGVDVGAVPLSLGPPGPQPSGRTATAGVTDPVRASPW
jgi:hypothetical protein